MSKIKIALDHAMMEINVLSNFPFLSKDGLVLASHHLMNLLTEYFTETSSQISATLYEVSLANP